ncbi:type VI secretion system-associated FHA domain protein TagH [Rhodobacteraceae bacterium CYK-10]|uniref:Type VI secretion system-associated FHA domain protein TagH n=2 Tax=Stagnihabitans tardus TaxID=2699202 RepID=A0AAE4YFQ6_9RHOB|nr:type VI secretion system-associated FHA domain protein TagH [Stagnihabitans tardus]
MRGPSLSIGRGPENDLVLPDPDRMISKTHCVIENQGGNIVVVDTSTNGTFLNYGKQALGRVATPLSDGDVLCLGPYELVVAIQPDQHWSEPLPPIGEGPASHGHAGRAPDPYQLLDDAAPGGDFLDSLLGPSKPVGPSQFKKPEDRVDLLPPIGEDGPLLAPRPEMPSGPAMRDHAPTVSDSFRVAAPVVSKPVIPDDWDDFLAPAPAPVAPAGQGLGQGADLYSHGAPLGGSPFAPTAPQAIPADAFDDFLAPPSPAAPPPAPEPEPEVEDPFAALLGASFPPSADPVMEAAPEPPTTPPPAAPAWAPEPTPPLAEAPQAAAFDPFSTDPNRPSAPPAQSEVLAPMPAAPPAPGYAAPPVAPEAPPAAPQAPGYTPGYAAPPVAPEAPPVVPPVAPVAPPSPQTTAAPGFGPGPQPQPQAQSLAADTSRAFLAALGAEEVTVPDADLPATMTRLGTTLRAMITGLREILMTRTSIKSEFRIEQTMVNVGGNNPLKFSVSPEQAIEAMVKPNARGYLPADQAATQALEDIKAHEIAMVTGMEAALKGVLKKLDPGALTQKIEAKGGFGGFLKNRKAQYWETYETMYAEIADQAENDFHELFAREFAQAYRAQLAKLKAAK